MLIAIVVVSVFVVAGLAMLLSYREMSARTLVATNVLSARVMVEEIVRNSNRVSPATIEDRINELSDYPGFEDVQVMNVDHEYPYEEQGMPKLMRFLVSLRDHRIGREETFYVYRYDPYAE